MRGRLIQRFLCVLHRLDPVATAAVVGGGYDDEFNEVLPVPDGTQVGAPSRREHDAVRLPCQIDREQWPQMELARGGYQAVENLIIALHLPDVEAAGLVGADGRPSILPGDRISAIETLEGIVQWTFPALFVQSVEPAGYGLAAFGVPQFNLALLHCAAPGTSEAGA